MAQIPPAFILPLLSPLSTTIRYPFSQCPTSKRLRGNPDLGRAFSKFSKYSCGYGDYDVLVDLSGLKIFIWYAKWYGTPSGTKALR
jgi:hypothetical protein